MTLRALVLVNCCCLLIAAGCHRAAEMSVAPPPAAPVDVRVATAREHVWPRSVRVQGSLIGDERAVVGAKAAGVAMQVLVDFGAEVTAGQPLAELDTTVIQLQVQLAKAEVEQVRAKLGLKRTDSDESLDPLKAPPVVQEEALRREAKANLERGRELLMRNVITTAELQQLQAALEVAEARFNSALNTVREQVALLAVRRAELARVTKIVEDSVVRAPFDGRVEQRHVAPGVYVQMGDPVVTLVRTDPLRYRAGVPERSMEQIEVGQRIVLRVDRQSSPVEAKISRISPSLNPANRSLTIEADVSNSGGRLRAGAFAEAEIEVDPEARTLVVPVGAVTEFAGLEKVWLIREGQAREQKVVTGRRDGRFVEILEGLATGDVVAADAERTRAGPVRITSQERDPEHPAD